MAFPQQHLQNVVVLQSSQDSSRVVVTGDYQARVMTSTAGGNAGKSFGWRSTTTSSHRASSALISMHSAAKNGSGWARKADNILFFFPPGKPFDFDNWQTPGLIDTAHYAVNTQSAGEVTYHYAGTVQNYSGTTFKLGITSTIRLLNNAAVASRINNTLPEGIKSVAYETENVLTNTGDSGGRKRTATAKHPAAGYVYTFSADGRGSTFQRYTRSTHTYYR